MSVFPWYNLSMIYLESEPTTKEASSQYNQMIIKTDDFLAFFHPHSVVALNPSQVKIWLKTMTDSIKQWIESGSLVCQAFEESTSRLPENVFKDLNYLFKNSGKRTDKSLSEDELITMFNSIEPDTGIMAYGYIKYIYFLELRRFLGKRRQLLTGIMEQTPKMHDPINQFFTAICSPESNQTIKLKYFQHFLNYITARDLRMAGQVAEFIKENPGGKIISERGSIHIGLIPALHILTNNSLAVIDPRHEYKISIQEPLATLYPVLWDMDFWTAITSQGFDSHKASLPVYDKLLINHVKSVVSSDPWSQYLKDISKNQYDKNRHRVISLPAINFTS